MGRRRSGPSMQRVLDVNETINGGFVRTTGKLWRTVRTASTSTEAGGRIAHRGHLGPRPHRLAGRFVCNASAPLMRACSSESSRTSCRAWVTRLASSCAV